MSHAPLPGRASRKAPHRPGRTNSPAPAVEETQLLSILPSILICVDASGRVTEWNPAAERAFALPKSQVLSRPLGECDIEWQWDRIAAGIEECRRRRRVVRVDDIRYGHPGGARGVLSVTLNPTPIRGLGPSGIVILGSDTTERKSLEARLLQARKLESIGQLAAGVAHEINTPTQYVGDNLHFLDESFGGLVRLLGRFEALLQLIRHHGCADELVSEVDVVRREIDFAYLFEEIPKAIRQSLDGIERVSQIARRDGLQLLH